MLDRIPFGGVRGIVADRDAQAVAIAEFLLEGRLPGAAAGAVAAAAVGQDQEPLGLRVRFRALPSPPLFDAFDGELGGFVTAADKHRPAIGLQIVDAIGNRDPRGVGGEVVIVHRQRLPIPFDAAVFESAYQFLLFWYRH